MARRGGGQTRTLATFSFSSVPSRDSTCSWSLLSSPVSSTARETLELATAEPGVAAAAAPRGGVASASAIVITKQGQSEKRLLRLSDAKQGTPAVGLWVCGQLIRGTEAS